MKRSIVNVDEKQFLLDNESGEVLQEVPDDAFLVMTRTRDQRRESFALGMQADLIELAQKRLKPTAWRYLMLLIGTMDFENKIIMGHSRAAEILGVSRQHVYLCRKELESQGLVIKSKNQYGFEFWIVSPNVFWRGNVKRQANALQNVLQMSAPGPSQVAIKVKPTVNAKCTCGATFEGMSSDKLDDWLISHDDCENFDFEKIADGNLEIGPII